MPSRRQTINIHKDFTTKHTTTFSCFFLVVLFNLITVDGRLVTVPRSAVITTSGSAVFQCGTDLYLQGGVAWRHLPVGALVPMTMAGVVGSVDGRYRVDTSGGNGRYDLVVRGPRTRDAGRFICTDDDGFSDESASAELVVLGDGSPSWTYERNASTAAGGGASPDDVERVTVRCRFTLVGNADAQGEWLDPDGLPILDAGWTRVINIYNEHIGVAEIELGMDEARLITYRVSFSTFSFYSSIAIPKLISAVEWKPPLPPGQLRVYGLRDDGLFDVGQSVECRVDVQASTLIRGTDVTITWLDTTSGMVTIGSRLTLGRFDGTRLFRCTGRFGGVPDHEEALTVEVTLKRNSVESVLLLAADGPVIDDDSGPDNEVVESAQAATIPAILLGLLLALAAILFVTIYFDRHRRVRKEPASTTSDAAKPNDEELTSTKKSHRREQQQKDGGGTSKGVRLPAEDGAVAAAARAAGAADKRETMQLLTVVLHSDKPASQQQQQQPDPSPRTRNKLQNN